VFKLAGKQREGARVRKRYHPPATPAQRLLTDPRTSEDVRLRITACQATLDPVHLLSEMRSAQRHLVEIADQAVPPECEASPAPTLEEFLSGLQTAWHSGEVRPTAVPKAAAKRTRRRPDPFASASEPLREWFEAEPWRTGRELLERLQAENPGVYPDGQLRTLQRRLKIWRQATAHKMVFGALSGVDGAK
jgi:hypothetical protein